ARSRTGPAMILAPGAFPRSVSTGECTRVSGRPRTGARAGAEPAGLLRPRGAAALPEPSGTRGTARRRVPGGRSATERRQPLRYRSGGQGCRAARPKHTGHLTAFMAMILTPGSDVPRKIAQRCQDHRGSEGVAARGGEERLPLDGGEGEVAEGGVLGVPKSGPGGGEGGDFDAFLPLSAVAALAEVGKHWGHLDAVLVVAAVTALAEAGGDLGHFDAVGRLSAVAALVEDQVVSHARSPGIWPGQR